MLEESSFANRKADYFWLLLQSAVMLLVRIPYPPHDKLILTPRTLYQRCSLRLLIFRSFPLPSPLSQFISGLGDTRPHPYLSLVS